MTMDVPPIVEALSGSVGASLANVLIYPLDLVIARIQTKTPQSKSKSKATTTAKDAYADLPTSIKTIYSNGGGIAGFYQGIASDTLSSALSNFLYFYMFAALHNVARNWRKNDGTKGVAAALPALQELFIGCLAGILSRGVTTPLSTITVRKQTAAKSKSRQDEEKEQSVSTAEDEEDEESDYSPDSSMAIARDIYQEHGLSGFWRGYESACILTINPAITFYLIEAFKNLIIPSRFRDKPTQRQTFLISATASAIASALCYPLILAKTRLQWKSPSGKLLYRNLGQVFTKTVSKSGVAGLYAGLQAQIIKGFLSQGVTMVLKQRVELLILSLYRILWMYRKQLTQK